MGNLCREPDLKKTPSGASVSELRLAVSEVFRDRTTNERTERTCFVDVTVWNQQAELCRQYLTKGSPIFVEGRLTYDEWKTPQGESRSRLRVVADRVQFLHGNRASSAPASTPAPSAPNAPASTFTPPPPAPSPDDPPF